MLKKISEYLPDMTSGLFTAFNNPIWATSFQDTVELDTYFYLRYGDRIGNKLIKAYADDTGVVDSKKVLLAKMIYSINAKKWEHLYKVYNAEYNPIENTDFIETITDVDSNTRVVDTETGNTRVVDGATSNTRVIDNDTSNSRVVDTDTTNSETATTESSGTATTESSGESSGENANNNNIYGFNSVAAVGDTTSSGSDSNSTSANSETTTSANSETTTGGTTTEDTLITDTGTDDSTITDNGTEDSTITDNGTEDSTITDNGMHTSEHRKHGNIGVTENVTMLEHEVAFWKWSFIDSVCQDICDIIALSIY